MKRKDWAVMSPETKHEVVVQAALGTPSAAAVLWTKVMGLSIDNWLGLFGIGFIVLQAMYLLWKWWRDIQKARREDAR